MALLIDGEKHGYQLRHEFESATGAAWPLNVGQVYTTLQRLERDGLVEADTRHEPTGDDQAGRVPYALTDRGRSEAERWLSTPSAAPLANRDETTMRILVALATGATRIGAMLDGQRRSATETLQALTAMKAEPEQTLAWRLQLDRMIFLADSEIRWLDRTEERLAATLPDRLDRGRGDRRPAPEPDTGPSAEPGTGSGHDQADATRGSSR